VVDLFGEIDPRELRWRAGRWVGDPETNEYELTGVQPVARG
jgi:hypothetical protein